MRLLRARNSFESDVLVPPLQSQVGVMVQVVFWCAVRTTWCIRTSETSLTSVAPYHAGRCVWGVWGGGEEGEKGNCYCLFLSPQHDLDDADRSMLFVCSATHKTKVGGRQLPVTDSQGYKSLMSCHVLPQHAPTHTHTHPHTHIDCLAHVLFSGPN